MNDKLLTIDDVSKFTNLSRGIVWRAIREGHLKVFQDKRPMLVLLSDVVDWQKTLEPVISKNNLEFMYLDERKSIHQISIETGVSAMVIHRLMKGFCIPRRSRSESLKGKNTWDLSSSAYKDRTENISRGKIGKPIKVSEADRQKRREHFMILNRSPRSEQWTQKQRDAHKGEKSYRWHGGSDHYRGPNWQEQRRKARKRDDYTCQNCGVTEIELGKELDVHHVVPYRLFDNYEKANVLSNLISYCNSCHIRIEHETETLYR